MVNTLISDIIPLKVGTKWLYKPEGTLMSLFGGDIKMEVVEKSNNLYLLRFSLNGSETSIILKCEVDLSVVAFSKDSSSTLKNMSEFQEVQKTEIIRSPIISGTSWTNSFGTFKIVNSDYTFKSGRNTIPNCILLYLKDTSGKDNSFCIKRGVGIIYASLYIDNIGRVNIGLKRMN